MQIDRLHIHIEDLDNEIMLKDEECNKHRGNMEFIDSVIKEYRP